MDIYLKLYRGKPDFKVGAFRKSVSRGAEERLWLRLAALLARR
jgi:hypothetical protein